MGVYLYVPVLLFVSMEYGPMCMLFVAYSIQNFMYVRPETHSCTQTNTHLQEFRGKSENYRNIESVWGVGRVEVNQMAACSVWPEYFLV